MINDTVVADITTPEQYIQIHDCKPLTPNELNYGKTKLRISNSDELIPWEEIYTRIAAAVAFLHTPLNFGAYSRDLWSRAQDCVMGD